MHNYWSRILERRVSRRRAMASTGATAMATAFLIACGSDGDDGGGSSTGGDTGGSGTGGIVASPEDTSKNAKNGGTVNWYTTTEPNHLDGIAQGQSQLNVYNGMAYGSLVANKPGYKQPSSFTEVVPNMAESWEFSPDRTQITFKIRPGVVWQNRPPVNGRAFEAADVAANWQRYESLTANNAAANSNKKNPAAPIISVTATDNRTVVYKLNEPASYLMQRLARMVTGEAGTIQPREALDGTFDPRKDQIGTGGFELEKWEPSVGLTYRRNPTYWNKSEPRFDKLHMAIIPEYSTGLASLQAGNLGTFAVRADDILPTKKQTPALNLYQTLVSNNSVGVTAGLGKLPWGNHEKSPFLDERVRQALSMSFDRETYIETFGNVSKFEDEGLPVESYWFSSIGYMPGVTLDPRESSFGENAKYFQYNVAESKKLLSAAGFADGLDVPVYFVNSGQFGQIGLDEEEVMTGWAREVGFNITTIGIDYNLEYLTKFITKRGEHDGWFYRRGAVSSPDPVDYFIWRYWSKSGATSGALGFDDPQVDSFIDKAKGETDAKVQTKVLHDLQKYLGKMQYCVPRPGVASTFDLAWPSLSNWFVQQHDSRAGTDALNSNWFYSTWVDQTKAPYA